MGHAFEPQRGRSPQSDPPIQSSVFSDRPWPQPSEFLSAPELEGSDLLQPGSKQVPWIGQSLPAPVPTEGSHPQPMSSEATDLTEEFSESVSEEKLSAPADSDAPPGSPDSSPGAAAGNGADPRSPLQDQWQRADRLGHHFDRISIFSDLSSSQAQRQQGSSCPTWGLATLISRHLQAGAGPDLQRELDRDSEDTETLETGISRTEGTDPDSDEAGSELDSIRDSESDGGDTDSGSSSRSNRNTSTYPEGYTSGVFRGKTVAIWNEAYLSLSTEGRYDRYFSSFEDALSLGRTLGRPMAVMEEPYADGTVYTLYPVAETDLPLTAAQTQTLPIEKPLRDLQGILTSDGFVLVPEAGILILREFVDDPFQSFQDYFGEGLQQISERDVFLEQFELAMQDTALTLLAQSEQEALEKLDFFAEVAPPLEGFDSDPDILTFDLQTSQDQAPPPGPAPGELATVEQVEQMISYLEQQQQQQALQQELDLIQQVSEQLAALDAQIYEAQQQVDLLSGVFAASDEIAQQQQQAAQQLEQLQQQREAVLFSYPQLARIEDPGLFARLSDTQQVEILRQDITQVLNDIETTRTNLLQGQLDLWTLEALIQTTQEGLQIQEQQKQQWLQERMQQAAFQEWVTDLGLATLQIALGVGATVATGGLAGAAAAGALGVGIVDAQRQTEQFLIERAASNTDLDPNQSLQPRDLEGELVWVVLAWVGVGIDASDALNALRALKAGTSLDTVVQELSQKSGYSAEVIRQAFEEAGAGPLDGQVLTQILKQSMSPELLERYRELQVTVLEAQVFAQRFGDETADAVTVLKEGEHGFEAEIFFREGGDPTRALTEEAAHLEQIADEKLAGKVGQLSEENLARWPEMEVSEQLDLYRVMLELEIDAQRRILAQYGDDPEVIARVEDEILELELRLLDVNDALLAPSIRPSWLDPDQPPRLFNHPGRWPEGRTDQIGNGGYYTAKENRRELYELRHRSTPAHYTKHIKAKTVEEAKDLSRRVAQYLPGLDNVRLEKQALINGTPFRHSESTTYFFYEFDDIIGYDLGVETKWIRAEVTSGLEYHGHPMSPERVQKYLRLIEERN